MFTKKKKEKEPKREIIKTYGGQCGCHEAVLPANDKVVHVDNVRFNHTRNRNLVKEEEERIKEEGRVRTRSWRVPFTQKVYQLSSKNFVMDVIDLMFVLNVMC